MCLKELYGTKYDPLSISYTVLSGKTKKKYPISSVLILIVSAISLYKTMSVRYCFNISDFHFCYYNIFRNEILEDKYHKHGEMIYKKMNLTLKNKGMRHLESSYWLPILLVYFILQTFVSQGGLTLVVIATSQVPHALHGWQLSQTVLRWTLIWWLCTTRKRMCLFSTVMTAISPG